MRSIATSIGNPIHESKQPGVFARRWLPVLAAAVFCFAGCENSVSVKNTLHTFRTVVIDAGHGGHDMGASSRWAGAEKNDALDTALRLEAKLRAAGFHTVLTRQTDQFVQLNDRARISNAQDNAIFIAIHYNQTGSRAIHGEETYYRSSVSRELAVRIQNAISTLPGSSSRGVKTANFRVLKRNEYPAVLVECGFVSNPSEWPALRCSTAEYHEARRFGDRRAPSSEYMARSDHRRRKQRPDA